MRKPNAVVIHVQPRASRTEIVGRHGDAIKVRLRAPPVNGAANDELIAFIAKTIGVPSSAVLISAGASQRRKRIVVDGMTADAVANALLGHP